jgi:hypothetical protein
LVAKLAANGSALLFSTYLGGAFVDFGYDLDVDWAGNVYVTGSTNSPNFPTTPGAFDRTQNNSDDAFVAKLAADGSAFLFSTYLGGGNHDYGYGLGVDGAGNVWVSGHTNSSNFPTVNPLQGSTRGAPEAFVAKLAANGAALLFSTYLGGSNSDIALGLGVDGAGNPWVCGYTVSTNFPTADPLQGSNRGGLDMFVAKLAPDGSALLFSTYLGGSSHEDAKDLAMHKGNAYLTGVTSSANFPTTHGAFDSTYNGSEDAYVTKVRAVPLTARGDV